MPQKTSLFARLKHHYIAFFWISAYLFVIFVLFQLRKYAVLTREGIPYTEFGISLIKALALAKVMLFADKFQLGQLSPNRPLLYPILLRSALTALVLIAFNSVEEIIKGMIKGHAFMESIPAAGGGDMLDTVVTTIIMMFMLIPFFGYMELGRVFGFETLKRLLFVSGTLQSSTTNNSTPNHKS